MPEEGRERASDTATSDWLQPSSNPAHNTVSWLASSLLQNSWLLLLAPSHCLYLCVYWVIVRDAVLHVVSYCCHPARDVTQKKIVVGLIWPQTDSTRGREDLARAQEDQLTGGYKWTEMSEDTTWHICEALEWLEETDGERSRTDEGRHGLKDVSRIQLTCQNSENLRMGEKDNTVTAFPLSWWQITQVTTRQHDGQKRHLHLVWSLTRWQFAANECGTGRTYDDNGRTVTNNDRAPAGNCSAGELDADWLLNTITGDLSLSMLGRWLCQRCYSWVCWDTGNNTAVCQSSEDEETRPFQRPEICQGRLLRTGLVLWGVYRW